MKRFLTNSEHQLFSTPLYQRAGWLVLIFLLVFAAFFWKERAICMDVAFQAFWLINEGTFQVQVNRFGVVLVQWLPLLAIKLGLSVSTILFWYSMSFVILQLVAFYLITRVFKSEFLGLAFTLLFVAQVEGSFYWTISEYQQGLSLLLVFFAFIFHRKEDTSIFFYLISLPFIVTLVFYHPLMFFIFGFLWAFFWLHYESIRRPKYYFLMAGMLATWLVKTIFFKNWYDASKERSLTENLEAYFPNYLAMDSNGQFLEHCCYTFFFFPILLLGILYFYFTKKHWLKGALVLITSVLYLFIINITYASDAEYFYLESFYFPMTLFVVIPIIFDLAASYHMRPWVLRGVLIFVVFRLFMIGTGHTYFTKRLNKIEHLVDLSESVSSQKVKVKTSVLGNKATEMTWAAPFETLMYSIVDKRAQQKSVFIYDDLHPRQVELGEAKTALLWTTKFYEQNKLNPIYFDFKEEGYLSIFNE